MVKKMSVTNSELNSDSEHLTTSGDTKDLFDLFSFLEVDTQDESWIDKVKVYFGKASSVEFCFAFIILAAVLYASL